MRKSEKFWDRISKNYDKPDKKGDETFQKIIEKVKKHLKNTDVVLDYACGTGKLTCEIANHVRKIQGIDISFGMIGAAKRRAKEGKIENINFALATILDEKYKVGAYDVILAFNILHLLEDPEETIQRIGELLKPGGIFISSTPCLGDKLKFLGFFLRLLSKIGILPYINRFKIPELEDLLAEESFQMVEEEKFSHDKLSYFFVARKGGGLS